jgi:hypothetical protein
VEERDEAEPKRKRDQVEGPSRNERPDDGLDERCDGGFADPAESERGERDTELADREVVVQVFDSFLYQSRPWFALFDESVYPRRAHLDERELRGHEQTVHGDEEEREEQPAQGDQIDHGHL